MIPCNSHWCLWAFILYFFPSLWISLDFLWISLDFCGFASNSKWIFYWFVATSYGFLWICIQFHRLSYWFVTTSYGFSWISVDLFGFSLISLDFFGSASNSNGFSNDLWQLPIDFFGVSTNGYPIPTAFLLICVHFDLENTILLHVDVGFVLVFAGIARNSTEIHSVFKQKMLTKWANTSNSEISLSMSDLLHTPY